jgi:hypothetical protein
VERIAELRSVRDALDGGAAESEGDAAAVLARDGGTVACRRALRRLEEVAR